MKQMARRRGRPRGEANIAEVASIQAIDRALDVLTALSESEGMTLSELAESLGHSVATMHRVLLSLERREIVEMTQERQAWFVGPEAFRIGSAFLRRTNVIECSRPIMRQLTYDIGETSNLGIEWNGRVFFLSQVETHQFIRAFFRPGTSSPMHASGIGKALLSAYETERVAALMGKAPLEIFTDKTIATMQGLNENLAVARKQGYAYDDEERAKGMRCVAAPIVNGAGEVVAGVSISGPTERIPDHQIDALGAVVREAASKISKALGGGLAR